MSSMSASPRRRAIWAVLAVATAVTVLPLARAPRAGAAGGDLRAGVGIGDLTPPVGTPQFAYTNREAAAGGVEPFVSQEDFDTNLYAKTFLRTVGVHTRPRARAVVLAQGSTKLALVQVDLGGFPYDLHQEVVKRIAATGIDRDHLMLSATHSHGSVGPIWPATSTGYAVLGGDAYDARVFAIVAQGIADAIVHADSALRPARAGVGTALMYDASNNRNLVPFARNPDVPPPVRPDGKPDSVNPVATVLRVEALDGTPLGMWSNFAIHGTSFGDGMLFFSGDNMAVSERIVEAELRRRGHLSADDVVVNAQSNGAEGDISPRGGSARLGDVPGALPTGTGEDTDHVVNSYGNAEAAGRRVARGLLEAWDAAQSSLQRDQVIDVRFQNLPLEGTANGEPIGPTPALGCGGIVCDDGQASPTDVPGQGRKIPLATGPTNPLTAPIHIVRVGGLVIAGLPFEATNQVGKRVRTAVTAALVANGFTPTHVVNAGLTDGYQSYSATPEEYEAYYYEGSFTLWGRQQSPFLTAALEVLAAALATGAPAPASADPPSTGVVAPQTPAVAPETDAVAVDVQPSDTTRLAQAVVTWSGGDPAADDPHVVIERSSGGGWVTETTDDSYEDTVRYDRSESPDGVHHAWTDTWEPGVCTPTGTYRFRITGLRSADGPYELTSDAFAVGAAAAPEAEAVRVDGTVARVRAAFPRPGDETIRMQPRLATGGSLTFVATAGDGSITRHRATFEAATYDYVASGVPAGSTVTVDPASVVDGCGNGAAASSDPVVPEVPLPAALVLGVMALAAGALALGRRRARAAV
jgi:neutral ceramidase